ncbi:MAG: hypothetical protein ICV83_32855 [Cytophagales bacterium]|nr:hypothetical protein [Cytophagales bacterium]
MESDATLEQSEHIDRYLKGQLSAPEQAAFGQRVGQDQAFAEEVTRQQSVRSLTRHYGYRQELAAIHREVMAERRSQSGFSVWTSPLRIAAAIALLLACAFVLRLSTLSTGGLVAQGYEAYAADVTRGEAYVPQDASQQLVREYANGNYDAVVKLFGQHASRSPQETLIAANAYLALSQPARAIPLLQQTISQGQGSDHRTTTQDAEYYLAWAYVKNNQLPEAERLFSAIYRNPDHKYNPDVDWSLYWNLKLLRLKAGL